MAIYQIYEKTTGVVWGLFEAESKKAALELLSLEFGRELPDLIVTDAKYMVKNKYGIGVEIAHDTIEAALADRDSRESDGWIVVDIKGNKWDRGFNGEPVSV